MQVYSSQVHKLNMDNRDRLNCTQIEPPHFHRWRATNCYRYFCAINCDVTTASQRLNYVRSINSIWTWINLSPVIQIGVYACVKNKLQYECVQSSLILFLCVFYLKYKMSTSTSFPWFYHRKIGKKRR